MEQALEETIRHFAKFIIDVPFSIVLLRIFAGLGAFEFFNLPTPTLRQSIGLVLIIGLVGPIG